MGPGGPLAEPPAVAETATLRRIERLAALYALAGAGAFLWRGDRAGALALTVVAVAGIVAFRGLEGVVRRLRAEQGAEGVRREGGGRLAWRWLLLAAILVTAIILGGERLLAVIVGLSAVPLAVISEGVLRLARPDTNGET